MISTQRRPPFGAPGLLLLGEQEHAAVQASLLVVVRRQR
jgi:hypothetical protein